MRWELLIALLLAVPFASAEEYRATIPWTDQSTSEAGFRIERKTGVAGVFGTLGSVGPDVEIFEDPGPLAETTEYCWRVVAFSVFGDGHSQEVCVTTPTPPEAPDVGTITIQLVSFTPPQMCGDPPMLCENLNPPAPPEMATPPAIFPIPPEGT